MNITPILSFQAKRASVALGMGHDGAEQRSICFDVDLDAGEYVETTEKRSLKDAAWSLSLHEGTEFNARATAEQNIGFLSHFPASDLDFDNHPESCYASVAIEQATFAAVWRLATAGRLPHYLSITVRDMAYGIAPDGSMKVWDVLNARDIGVTKLAIRFSVAGAPAQSNGLDDDPATTILPHPATSADVREGTVQVTQSLATLQAQLVRTLRYILGVAAIFALYMLFKWAP